MKAPLRVPIDFADVGRDSAFAGPSIAPGLAALPAEAATYATRVHRLGPGDALVVFDPDRAIEADAEIVDVGKRAVSVRIGEVRPAARRPLRAVTLIQGACKGDKMDAVVRDATELGATRIVPAIAERSVARPEAARAARWRRIAVEAARQCGRGDAPVIADPLAFTEALRNARDERALMLCMDPTAERAIGAALVDLGDRAVVIAVGPEGGLTAEEIEYPFGGGRRDPAAPRGVHAYACRSPTHLPSAGRRARGLASWQPGRRAARAPMTSPRRAASPLVP